MEGNGNACAQVPAVRRKSAPQLPHLSNLLLCNEQSTGIQLIRLKSRKSEKIMNVEPQTIQHFKAAVITRLLNFILNNDGVHVFVNLVDTLSYILKKNV